MNNNLYQKSIQIILKNQSPSGAYVASPNFPTYRYCWLRDGSFIAYAMDLAGEHTSACAFHRWVVEVIQRYASKVDDLERNLAIGVINIDDILHTRYTLDGQEENQDHSWGNFQIDGYGTWLWALMEHIRITGNVSLLNELSDGILTSLRYLRLTWKLPNYDCWEEHPEYLHSYSLGAVYAGFSSAVKMIEAGLKDVDLTEMKETACGVRDFLLRNGVHNGQLVKHIHPPYADKEFGPVISSGVDASLIALVVPYNVLSMDEPIFISTFEAIERDLHLPGGGMYRYRADTYFGAGEWLLLTAWLGWYYVCRGQVVRAVPLLSWIGEKADSHGNLPEQISDQLLAPKYYSYWLQRWGPVASPLLWSHAMYIILDNAIQKCKSK
ncbi:glycoside hydrolase [bacterium]|nr:MAG: glycoside hydrolase [bacterium]